MQRKIINTSAEGKPSNLYLGNYLNDLEISLSDTTPFTADARIGISLAKDTTTRFTSTGAEWKDVFVSDDEKFEIKTVDGEEGIYFTKKEDPSSGGQNPPGTVQPGAIQPGAADNPGTIQPGAAGKPGTVQSGAANKTRTDESGAERGGFDYCNRDCRREPCFSKNSR